MPGGSPGFFVSAPFDAEYRATLSANAHVHVDYHRFSLGRDGRATARARIVDETAEQRRSAPILSTDRGLFFFQREDEHDQRRRSPIARAGFLATAPHRVVARSRCACRMRSGRERVAS